jgi:hypothetical protein
MNQNLLPFDDETKKGIDQIMQSILGEDYSKYYDLDYSIDRIKSSPPDWKALASISVQLFINNMTSQAKTERETLPDSVLSITSECIGTVIAEYSRKTSTQIVFSEDFQILFHARMCQAGLLEISGKTKQSADMLLTLTFPELSGMVKPENWDSKILEFKDIFLGMGLASIMVKSLFSNLKDYANSIKCRLYFAIKKIEEPLAFEEISKDVDLWINECKSKNSIEDWISIFKTLSNLVETTSVNAIEKE